MVYGQGIVYEETNAWKVMHDSVACQNCHGMAKKGGQKPQVGSWINLAKFGSLRGVGYVLRILGINFLFLVLA